MYRQPSLEAWRATTPGSLASRPLVLVVEDELPAAGSLAPVLAGHGLRTLQVLARPSAVARPVGCDPDVVLLGAGRLSVELADLTARIRTWTSVPIVVVLDDARLHERADLLDAGADDCIGRPFAANDLVARVRLWIRQRTRTVATERLHVDRDRRSLFVDGHEVHLTPIQCKLFLVLAHSQGRALSEEQILMALWGSSAPARVPYLRANVRQLRLKLEKDPARPRYLTTEAGGGYRLKLA